MINYARGTVINGILILLTLLFLALIQVPERTADAKPAGFQEIPLVQRNVEDVVAVALKHGETRFGILHQDGRFAIEPSAGEAELSLEKLQSFIYRISKLTAVATVDSDSGDFGLASPRSRSTIIFKDGEKLRLALGRENPVDGSVYAALEGLDEVFLLKAEDAALFLSSPKDFLLLDLLPRIDLEDLDTLESLSFRFPQGNLPSFTIENRGSLSFRISAPYEGSLKYEKVLSALVFPLLSLEHKADSDRRIPHSPGTLNLEVTLQINGEQTTLGFFRENQSLFAVKDGRVYELDAEDLPFLTLHYRELLDGSIYHINISEIASLSISFGSEDYNIEMSGESTELHARLNGKDLEHSQTMALMEQIFQTGIAAELERSVPLNSDDPVDLTVRVLKKNGSRERLDFVPYEKNFLLFVNGTARFTTYEKSVTDIRRIFNEIAAAGKTVDKEE